MIKTFWKEMGPDDKDAVPWTRKLVPNSKNSREPWKKALVKLVSIM